jgi:hypothetical protein
MTNIIAARVHKQFLSDLSEVFDVVLFNEDKQQIASIPATDEKHAYNILDSICSSGYVLNLSKKG